MNSIMSWEIHFLLSQNSRLAYYFQYWENFLLFKYKTHQLFVEKGFKMPYPALHVMFLPRLMQCYPNMGGRFPKRD